MTLLVALFLAAAPAGALPEERFEEANARYRAGDYAGAAEGYEALVAERFTAAALHHNLGNARLRLGQRGAAIASWERVLLLAPGDADALANLAAARADDPDRALTGEPGFVARLVSRTSHGLATALFLVPWMVLWGLLALRSRRVGRARRVLGAGALAAASAALAGGLLLAATIRDHRFPAAVVLAPSAPVRDGPSAALKPAFELHEGTRVRVRELQGELVRIRLDGGLEGWLARRDLELL